jgi:myo-inositol-1(or 4)-monophosphatase
MKDVTQRFECLLKYIKYEGLKLKHQLNHQPNLKVSYKAQDDLVTQYDLAIEKALIEKIQKEFPEDAFLTEETRQSISKIERPTWIIDPIDGTTNFVHGYPFFCLSVALATPQGIMAGAVYNPILNEYFSALKGHGAYFNNRRLPQLSAELQKKALLVTGFPYRKKVTEEKLTFAISLFAQFQAKSQAVRRDGSAALDLCYVAAGRFSGFFELGLHPWDIAAGLLISSEVGAIHLDYSAQPTSLFGKELICAHPKLANSIAQEIQILNEKIEQKKSS